MKQLLNLWIVLAGAMLTLGQAGNLAAQAVSVDQVDDGKRQKLLFPSTVELEAGKALAESACARCHGLNGIGAAENLPHLAGQRALYLYLEILAYKRDNRHDESMRDAVKFLDEEALVQAAAYYASLEPPEADTAAYVEKDPVQQGKAATASCAGCHGVDGNATLPGMPSLTRLYPQYLNSAIDAYKGAGRSDTTMKSLVALLSDADVKKIALYYSLQPPKAAVTPVKGDAAAGQAAAAACAGCHGEDGNSADPKTPSLAGQDAQYLALSIRSYMDGKRIHETMKSLVASLSDADIENLAAFYAKQQPKAPGVRKPLTVAEWATRCDRCHGIDGNSTDPVVPAIAGQQKTYLALALQKYKNADRPSAAMHAMSQALSDTDIENLASYYAHKRSKAVVFVNVCKPANEEK